MTEGKFPAHCNVLCTLVAGVEETRGRGGEELVREYVSRMEMGRSEIKGSRREGGG